MSDRDDPTLPRGDDDAAELLVGYEPVDEPAVHDPHRHPDRDEEAEERAALVYGWSYLAVLFAVFLGLAFLAYGCDDDQVTAGTGLTTSTAPAGSGETAALGDLVFVVDGTTVILTGSVPDDEAREQLVDLAEARYGEGNVVDQLLVAEDVTLEGATVTMRGTTDEGDDLPRGLMADVVAAMGLTAGDFDVAFGAVEAADITTMDVEAAVSTDAVQLSGSVPDQPTFDALVSAATTIWGDGNVDAGRLVIDEAAALAGGRISLTGTVDAGDARPAALAATVGEALGVEVADGVEIDTGPEALGRLEVALRDSLAADPIRFATGSADIDPASDATLQQAAAAINAAPGIAVEIVGHTDDQGQAENNQALSESRANAVLNRLVELGVDDARLNARGAGALEPVADNATAEGRAANRRIVFEFEGAGEG